MSGNMMVQQWCSSGAEQFGSWNVHTFKPRSEMISAVLSRSVRSLASLALCARRR